MKYVVIGGGIAGLSIGACLQKRNRQFVICERQQGPVEQGHAFLLHTEAFDVLHQFTTGGGIHMPGVHIDTFSLRRPDGHEVKRQSLDSWRCIKRSDLVTFLQRYVDPACIKTGRTFSHFVRRQGRIVGAAFADGHIEYGDIFIGADGSNSRVREELMGAIRPGVVAVKEIVGKVCGCEVGQRQAGTFIKYQHDQYGLAFGMIPTGADELVWFMQFDSSLAEIKTVGADAIRSLCGRLLRDFPSAVAGVLDTTDFNSAYVWNTRDFDLIPSFHRENVVLLGDAAHLVLPFSSTGTSNAIIGAGTLAVCLDSSRDPQTAFREYYLRRAPVIKEHIRNARALRLAFLFPHRQQADVSTPLLPQSVPQPAAVNPDPFIGHPTARRIRPGTLRVRYFTDPICSTCWIIQPTLKKMALEYGHCLDIIYYMGGLLPSWDTCEGMIKSPADAARLWKDVDRLYHMPIDGDIWLEDPLSSSFPPSIAFKAAQLQDERKAVLFLRRIREMLFLEKKNIMRWKYLLAAADEVNLDLALFKSDYEGKARSAFQQDLMLAEELNIKSFPHLIFSNASGLHTHLKGHFSYDDVASTIHELLPHAQKRNFDPEPGNLFSHFPTLLEEEFAILTDLVTDDARRVLRDLAGSGRIKKLPTKKGDLYTLS